MSAFAGWTLVLAILVQTAGCCHDHTEAEKLERARAEDFKDKWLREVRFHYETLLIKTKELEDLAETVNQLKAENEELRKKLAEKKGAESK